MADVELQSRLKPLRRSLPAVADPEAGRAGTGEGEGEGEGERAGAASAAAAPSPGKNKTKKPKKATPSFLAVLSLCDPGDALLLVVGCIGAAANGAALPLFSLAFGAMVDVLGPAATAGALRKEVERVASYFLILAAGALVASYIEVAACTAGGARLARRLRLAYVRSALRQEVSFHDAGGDTEEGDESDGDDERDGDGAERLTKRPPSTRGPGALLAALSADADAVQVALGDKLGNAVHHGSTFVAGMIVAFSRGWAMTLVMLATLPLAGAAGGAVSATLAKLSSKSDAAYARAGVIATEALGNARAVAAAGAASQVARAYSRALELPEKAAATSSALQGAVFGLASATFLWTYALALWFGWTRVRAGEYTGGQVMSVLFAAQLGGVSLGHFLPNLEYFARARDAGGRLLGVIRREPKITTPTNPQRKSFSLFGGGGRGSGGSGSFGGGVGGTPRSAGSGSLSPLERSSSAGSTPKGRRPTGWVGSGGSRASNSPIATPASAASAASASLSEEDHADKKRRRLSRWAPPPRAAAALRVRGHLEFRSVSFAYDARPETLALNALDLDIPAGKTTALCGSSGSGKSTALALMLRLYDPTSGAVLLDGADLRSFDPRAFRAATALVPQEPTLFSCSVADNIRFGRPSATDEEIRAAAAAAGAAEFVERLPQGFATLVGERGGQLSGGQRQRIAIARAIVREPKIMFLDEATAALDAVSQRVVQDSLARLRKGNSKISSSSSLTTVIVAHRLSTIADADRIVVMSNGRNVEQGTHSELLEEGGEYSALVRLQVESGEMGSGGGGGSGGGSGGGGGGGGGGGSGGGGGGGGGGGSGGGAGGASSSSSTAPVASSSSSPSSSSLPASFSTASSSPPVVAPAVVAAASPSASPDAAATAALAATSSPAKANNDDGGERQQSTTTTLGWRRLWELSRGDWHCILFGVLGSAALGFQMPGFALTLAPMIAVFYTPPEQAVSEVRKWSLVFFAIGLGVLVAATIRQACLGRAGSRLTRSLRERLLEAALKQEIAWFDSPENSTGALAARLSADAAHVRGAAGDALGVAAQAASGLGGGLIIAFVSGWRLALVILAAVPLLVVAAWVQGAFLAGNLGSKGAREADDKDKRRRRSKKENDNDNKKLSLFSRKRSNNVSGETKNSNGADGNSNNASSSSTQNDDDAYLAQEVASEALAAPRVVAALGLDVPLATAYDSLLAGPARRAAARGQVSGVAFGLSQFVLFSVYALSFYYGGRLVADGSLSFEDMMRVFFAIMLSAIGFSQTQMAFPDLARASGACRRVAELLDRVPAVDGDAGGIELGPRLVPPAVEEKTTKEGSNAGLEVVAVDASSSSSAAAVADVPPAPPASTSPSSSAPSSRPPLATRFCRGEVEFRAVSFAYPSRKSAPVLKEFNLHIPAGKTVALVGPSGGGKSTVLSLLERFYDVDAGSVSVDGHDVRSLSLPSLRSRVALVAQEPVMFTGTIRDNVLYGLGGFGGANNEKKGGAGGGEESAAAAEELKKKKKKNKRALSSLFSKKAASAAAAAGNKENGDEESAVVVDVSSANGSKAGNAKAAIAISDAQIRSALEAANAADFVFGALGPQGGLDARLCQGDGGVQLSGGQKQRLAIARALLRDSAVLLLDEATSALDAASESLIVGALERASRGRTTVVVAHRLSTVAKADKLAVVGGGKVVEEGTHAELLVKGGAYAALMATNNGSNSMMSE